MSTFPDFDGTQNCAQPGIDPESFFPHKNGSGAKAKRICASDGTGKPCPFLDGCREYGVTHSVTGIWGGRSEEERQAERKARHIIPEPLAFRAIAGAEITTNVFRRHGSWAGVGQHVRNNEPVCDECREYRNGRRRRKAAMDRGEAS